MSHVRLGDRRIDLVTGEVTTLSGRTVCKLTPIEAALLTFLVSKDEAVVSRSVVLSAVWGYRATVRTRTVGTTVARLRAKIETDPTGPRHLQTIHGQGLRLVGVHQDSTEPVSSPEARVRHWLETDKLVAIVGPPGSRIGALGEQIATGWPSVAHLHEPLPATRPDVALLVVDGHSLQPDSWRTLSRWARLGPVLAVGRTSTTHPVRTLRVEPLRRGPARDRLTRLAEQVGQALTEEEVARLVECVDGLPDQLLACAQFGGGPVRSLRVDPLLDEVNDRLMTLSSAVRTAAGYVAAFEGAPSLDDLRVVDPTYSALSLAELQSIGWLELVAGRARMVRGLREALAQHSPPVDRVAWAHTLKDRVLFDGITSLAPVAADVGLALAACTSAADAETISGVWRDLALLEGRTHRFLPQLAAAAARFPSSAVLALRLALLRGRVVTQPDESTTWRSSEAIEAYYLRLVHASVQGSDPTQLRAATAARVEQAPFTLQGRFLPQLYARLSPSAFRTKIQPLREHATAAGWSFVLAHIRRFELETLVRHGHYTEALVQQDQWPTDSLLGADASYFLGLAALWVDRPEEARAHFQAMQKRRPSDASFAALFEGVVAFSNKEDALARDRLLRAADGTLPAGAPSELLVIALDALGEPGVRPPTHAELAALVHSPLPQDPPKALPARVLWHSLRTRARR